MAYIAIARSFVRCIVMAYIWYGLYSDGVYGHHKVIYTVCSYVYGMAYIAIVYTAIARYRPI